MDKKTVKDLMVPLDEYPAVGDQATVLEALEALDRAQQNLPSGRQPYRAVLVVDRNDKIVGKLGQMAFLNALEPKYNVLGDVGRLAQAGVSDEFISSMMEHYRFFQDSLNDLCRRAATLKVKDVMHSVTESIDEHASLGEAIHKIVIGQMLSILVTRGDDVVGLLRLADLFETVAGQMKQQTL